MSMKRGKAEQSLCESTENARPPEGGGPFDRAHSATGYWPLRFQPGFKGQTEALIRPEELHFGSCGNTSQHLLGRWSWMHTAPGHCRELAIDLSVESWKRRILKPTRFLWKTRAVSLPAHPPQSFSTDLSMRLRLLFSGTQRCFNV